MILGTLLLFSVAAWALVIWQAQSSSEMMSDLTMGLSAPLFLAIWVTMMIAMMFPAAAPMILTFARISTSKRERSEAFVPTWLFVGAYLLLWSIFGVLAFGLAQGAELAMDNISWIAAHTGKISGVLFILAGLYQLSPLKRVCLTKCRTPLTFVLTSWRDGWTGAIRMGLEHGLFCLGCCWLLFVILFPLGIMNLAAMAVLTLVIFAEKALPLGVRVSQATALVLILAGILTIAFQGVMPASDPMGPMPGM